MNFFRIPSGLENLRFSKLPVSKRLAAVLGRLKLRCLGDLTRIGWQDLRAVSKHAYPLIKELDDLIERSQRKVANRPRIARSPRTNASGPVRSAYRPSVNQATQPGAPIPGPTRLRSAVRMFVPLDIRNRPMPKPPTVSGRLSNILNKNGFQVLGDLHGLLVSDFRQLRGSGRQSLLELEGFLRGCEGGFTTAEFLARPVFTAPPPPFQILFVADSARALSPFDLPLALRARKTLKRLGIKSLGDLNAVTTSALLKSHGCGKKTVLEIQTLLKRANNGDFDTSPKALQNLTALDVLLRIDEWLRSLPKRHSRFVRLRFGGNGRPPLTLTSIGAKGGVTGMRVAQIVNSALATFLHRGGPKMKFLLDQIATSRQKGDHPLTPEIVREWSPKPWQLSCKPEFYARVIGAMQQSVVTPPWQRLA